MTVRNGSFEFNHESMELTLHPGTYVLEKPLVLAFNEKTMIAGGVHYIGGDGEGEMHPSSNYPVSDHKLKKLLSAAREWRNQEMKKS